MVALHRELGDSNLDLISMPSPKRVFASPDPRANSSLTHYLLNGRHRELFLYWWRSSMLSYKLKTEHPGRGSF